LSINSLSRDFEDYMSFPLPARLASLLVTLLLASCASMKGIEPQASMREPNALAASRTLAGATVTPAAWPKSDWWTSLDDPQLDALMDEALRDSPTLAIAAARTRKALAARSR